MIGVNFRETLISNYARDVHVIGELLDFIEISDLYDVTDKTMKPGDPKRFLHDILQALREAQPDPVVGKKPVKQDGCTIGFAADLSEEFWLSQLGKNPTDERQLRLVKDLRRVRSLIVLASKRLELTTEDAINIRWVGDVPTLGTKFDQWVSQQPTSVRKINETILPYISLLMPSKKEYENLHQAESAESIKKEYPTR